MPHTHSLLLGGPSGEASSGTTCLLYQVPPALPRPDLPLPCCGPVGKSLSLSEPMSCLVNCKPISLNLPASPSYFLERNHQGMKEGCLGHASSQHRWVIHLAVFLLCLF